MKDQCIVNRKKGQVNETKLKTEEEMRRKMIGFEERHVRVNISITGTFKISFKW